MSLNQTVLPSPISDLHTRLQAKMTEFAGYSLPLYFEGFKQEHLHTRSHTSLFDISHMGIIELSGPGIETTLEQLSPANIQTLPVNRSVISVLTNEQGGVIDDMMLSRTEKGFRLVANGSRKQIVIEHLLKHLDQRQKLDHLDKAAFLALQGPDSESALKTLVPDITKLRFLDAGEFVYKHYTLSITRSGYSGEDGFEIAVDADHAIDFVETLLQNGLVKPAGLGARDSLRMEAGLCLYGHELNETITPVEAGLSWMIPASRRNNDSHFYGRNIILSQLENGSARLRVGLIVEGKVPVREGTVIFDNDMNEIGIVTSGVYSPTLDKPIAQAYIDREHAIPGKTLHASVRKKTLSVKIAALPLVKLNYKR